MDSFESRMNPRFLAESEKGMLWEPRVIESGRETVEGFKEDEKGKRRASVLSSFSLSRFSVIHVFLSSVYDVFRTLINSLVFWLVTGAWAWYCVRLWSIMTWNHDVSDFGFAREFQRTKDRKLCNLQSLKELTRIRGLPISRGRWQPSPIKQKLLGDYAALLGDRIGSAESCKVVWESTKENVDRGKVCDVLTTLEYPARPVRLP